MESNTTTLVQPGVSTEGNIAARFDQKLFLASFNDTAREYPRAKCLHELFEAQVERTPDAIAVAFRDRQLTYRQLNTRANQVAHRLRHFGIGPESLVGICVERSLEMVI